MNRPQLRVPGLAALVVPGLVLLLAAACGTPPATGGGDGGSGDGGTSPTTWKVASVIDLGSECTNAGSVAVTGTTAWVGCTGDYAPGDARLAEVDLGTGAVTRYPIAGAPGPIAIAGSGAHYTVLVGDLADGRLTATDVTGATVATPSDPVTLCPADPANNIYDYLAGLVPAGSGVALASCFATDKVIRVGWSTQVAAGKTRLTATVQDHVTVGDGPGDLASMGGTDALVLDGLAATASVVHAGTALTADVDRYQTSDTPNAVRVDGSTAFVANSTANTLLALDLTSAKPLFETPTGDNSNPWSVALSGGQALVSLNVANAVAVIDTTTGHLDQTLALPTGADLKPFPGKTPLGRPQGIAATTDGKVVVAMTNLDQSYAAAGDGLLVVLAPAR